MSQKRALITGITGQDGAYLTSLLIRKGYEVHGIKRRSSVLNTVRLEHHYRPPQDDARSLHLHYGDLTDQAALIQILTAVRPHEVYNLGAQSHVRLSFDAPNYTTQVDALGCLNLLEALRLTGQLQDTRFYQASSSEMFGNSPRAFQDELTPFAPRSPYGIAKLYAHWLTINYRDAHGLHASSGILFNHESPLRAETFVTRKITQAVARCGMGEDTCLFLGCLDARRDWGHAREFAEGMWRILNHSEPDVFVLATGRSLSVREFAKIAFAHIGITLEFRGSGLNEMGIDAATGKTIIRIDPQYYRPTEVNHLQGCADKANELLAWQSNVAVEELCHEMIEADLCRLRLARGERLLSEMSVEQAAQQEGGLLEAMRREGIATFCPR